MFKDKHKMSEFLNITLGVIIVSVGFHFFYEPLKLVTGGVTGSSILFVEFTGLSEIWGTVFMYTLNIILLCIGGLVLGKAFLFKTFYGTLLLPTTILLLQFLPSDILIREITSHSGKLLIGAVCGAAFTGFGLGLVFKNNATTGGTDVLQQILHKKAKISYSLALYLTDGIIIAVGFYKFGFENTFYAILALVISGMVIDKVMISGRSGYTVFIVTNHYELMKNAIYAKINRGVTNVPVKGGYSENHKDMILCTVSRNQLYRLKEIVADIDPSAFTIITKTTESVGLGFK